MPRVPRRHDPLSRQVLGTYRAPQRDCVCGEPWRKHAPGVGDVRGYCLDPDCTCLRYQPQEVARG